ncbi:UNVERIFIED_ORG: hypothetical protein ABIC62_004439 [Burkholderia sp. 1595]|uniref:Uncharacterized protein n=1 Tax=Paraburkholderia terricola TaxID=169427 RepID=A0ABU1LWA5_9BURK|nr:hypothetical protein [Paraburkholderia terricola]MDR6483306.1 hypothetical protein [Paraburkholderia terricola]
MHPPLAGVALNWLSQPDVTSPLPGEPRQPTRCARRKGGVTASGK